MSYTASDTILSPLMCGIFGFTGVEDERLLRRMGEQIVHRGPDSDGYYSAPELSMGVRRLSIIDLDGGRQPVTNEDDSLVLCYNGEIYNHVELIDELEKAGHVFRSHCDTEVVVHAFEEWGERFVDRLNGMFAFALWDVRRRELWIARDRTGQKPLYYHEAAGRLVFGSEIKSILECPHVERQPNLAAIDPFLALRYVPQPQTMFAGIQTLPAGHLMRWRDGRLSQRRYWDVTLTRGPYLSAREYRDRFEELFFDAVRLTLRSDVPVGAYLSAGVDSSLVVAAMRRYTDRLETFSIGFGSPIDETADARRLAEHLGCTHHEVNATPQDFELLPRVLWHLERPIGDVLILAYYLLACATSEHVKVVLSGEGADESFAGYSFHKIIRWTEWATRALPGFVPERIAAPIVDALPVDLLDKLFVFPAHLGVRGRRRAADYLRHYKRRHLAGNYGALRSLFDLPERRELYAPEFRERATEDWLRPPRDGDGPFLDRLLKLQWDDWLQDNLLLRQDKNTMAHSLELRCPFLDHRIIELAFKMPARMKIRRGVDKWIERDLARKLLPADNVVRSKNPFYFPLEFFRESAPMRELIALTLDDARVRRRGYFDPARVRYLVEQMETGEFLYLKQVMSLVILELWHMVFMDKQRMW